LVNKIRFTPAVPMADGDKAPDDKRASSKDPHTRELWFGDRLDSGWLKPRRREDSDGGRR